MIMSSTVPRTHLYCIHRSDLCDTIAAAAAAVAACHTVHVSSHNAHYSVTQWTSQYHIMMVKQHTVDVCVSLLLLFLSIACHCNLIYTRDVAWVVHNNSTVYKEIITAREICSSSIIYLYMQRSNAVATI